MSQIIEYRAAASQLKSKEFFMHDLSKYTVPTSFVRMAVPTKVMGMLLISAFPTKVVGMQAVYQSSQIQE